MQVTDSKNRTFKLMRNSLRQSIPQPAQPGFWREVSRKELQYLFTNPTIHGRRWRYITARFSDGTHYPDLWMAQYLISKGLLGIGCVSFNRKTTSIIRKWALGGKK